jgi:aldose sugar dehydrogenase
MIYQKVFSGRVTSFLLFIFSLLLLVPINYACSQTSVQDENVNCVYIEDGFGPDGTIEVKSETVVSGLEVPWGIAFLPNGDLLVTERPGRIRLVRDYNGNAQLEDQPVATFDIPSTSEGGLLGIALHPEFESNRLFYVYVTTGEGSSSKNQVEQWRLYEDGTSASQVRVIFDDIDASRNHNGGRIKFGPDNMLYIGTGDASSPDKSQDPKSPNGKLLRLTSEGDIPGDNPVSGSPVYLLGIRNTQGWDWPDQNDATTVWLTDHGPSGDRLRFGHDEVSIAKVNDNLGWPEIYRCEKQEGLLTPVITWKDAVPPGGAAIYTGSAIPEWKGSLLIGSLGARHLQRVVIDNNTVTSNEVYFRNEQGRLREVIMSPEGDLFITTSNCDGRGNCPGTKDSILRIVK